MTGSILAAAVSVAALASDNLTGARVGTAVGFAVLLLAIWLGARGSGRIAAACAMGCLILSLASFTSTPGDWIAVAGLATGSTLLAVAMLRAGGWAAARRRRWVVVLYCVVAGVPALGALALLVFALPQLLAVPPGCVDTCMGPGIGVFFSVLALEEVLVITMTATAFAKSLLTGLGALTFAVAENVLFIDAPPHQSVTYFAAIVAWLAGASVLSWPWTQRRSPALIRDGAVS